VVEVHPDGVEIVATGVTFGVTVFLQAELASGK